MTKGRLGATVFAAVVRRELATRRVATVVGVMVSLGALAAWGAPVAPGGEVVSDPAAFIDSAQPILFGFMLAGMTAYLVVERVTSDQERGWLNPLFALGASRHRYLFGTVAGVTGFAITMYGAGVTGYLIVRTFAGASISVASYGRTAVKISFLLASYSVFAAFWAVFARRRSTALALVLGTFVAPWLAYRSLGGLPGQRVGPLRLLFVHLPPTILGSLSVAVTNQIVYTGFALLLVFWIGNRNLSRYT